MLFAATAANDACNNYGTPDVVDLIARHYMPSCVDTYTFDPNAYWGTYGETPKSYGDTIDTDPEGCGDVTYQVECDNVDSSIVYMNSYWTDSLSIKPRNVDNGDVDFLSTCYISAYFTDYAPDASLGQKVWAEYTFYIDWIH